MMVDKRKKRYKSEFKELYRDNIFRFYFSTKTAISQNTAEGFAEPLT